MCGIVGFCDSKITDGDMKKRICAEMRAKIKHRGPDGLGEYSDEFVTLGFARLKILDLEGGNQPMISRDGRYVLCFNGEIYNYKELREELQGEFGERFFGDGDTEVLLSILTHYGERALEKLRGMFAIVFYDREKKSLLLARDPFGIKPLYYGFFDGCLMFASEIKAFLSHPQFKKEFNSEVLPYYLQFQYVPTEDTAFVGVKRLMPGYMLTYCDKKASVEKWFDMPVYAKNEYRGYSFFAERDGVKREYLPYKRNEGEVSEILYSVLEHAVKRHMRADVEVGGFLSGGVDSGLISALARPKKLFTVGFKNAGFDERARAEATAHRLGIPITSLEIDGDDFFDCVEAVQYHSDEPYANLSAIPLYLISKKAREEVGVILSGEGADELFGGYEWYEDSFYGKVYRTLPTAVRKTAAKKALAGRIGDFLKRNSGDAEKEFIGQAKIMTAGEAYSILREPYKILKNPTEITEPIYSEAKNATLLRKKMYLDSKLWLPCDILNKADKMTMASSLELRVPYLDLSVLSVAQGCGERLLMRGGASKYVLRRCALKTLDGQCAYRAKKGFPVPFRSWIREGKYAKILKEAFTGEICRKFFDADKLLALLDEHIRGVKNNARVLYTVYAFTVWYSVFFEREEAKTMTFEAEMISPINREILKNDTQTAYEHARKRGKRIKEAGDDEGFSADNSRL